MTAFQAFGRGWTAAGRSKVALVLMWFVYALITRIAAIPALIWLIAPLAHSRTADQLLARFDIGWLGDLGAPATNAGAAIGGAAAFTAVVTWLIAVLFAGGVLRMLNERWTRFSFPRFMGAAGEYFWRILRLSLFGLVCYALVVALGRAPVWLARRIWGHGMEAWPIGVAGIVSSVLTLLLLGWMATVLDYAKVRLVSDESRRSFRTLLHSFAFVWRHFGVTMGIWLLNALLFALAGVAYLKASNAIHATGAWTILLLIVVQQAFIFFRTAQRVAVWGAALAVYDALKEPPLESEFVAARTGGLPPELRTGAQATPEPPEWEGDGI